MDHSRSLHRVIDHIQRSNFSPLLHARSIRTNLCGESLHPLETLHPTNTRIRLASAVLQVVLTEAFRHVVISAIEQNENQEVIILSKIGLKLPLLVRRILRFSGEPSQAECNLIAD